MGVQYYRRAIEETARKFLGTILDAATPLITTLNKGANNARIAEFERETGVILLLGIRRLYQTFNGQKKSNNDVFFINELRSLPLSGVKETQQQWLQRLEKVPNWQDFGFDEREAIGTYWGGVVRNQFYNPKWLPFLADGVHYVFIDLDPDERGIVGQIGELELSVDSTGDSFMDILNESISEWLGSISGDLGENLTCYNPGLCSLADSLIFDEGDVIFSISALTPNYVPEGGSDMYDCLEKDQNDFVIPDRNCVYMDETCEHFERYVGAVDSALHEITSECMHINVYWIKPTAEHPYRVLFTTNMGDYPMYLPEDLDDPNSYSRVELMACPPTDWRISNEAFKDSDNYWPVYFLEMIARFLHQYKTQTAEEHTIPNGGYAEPIANTEFDCVLLIPSYLSVPEEFLRLEIKDGVPIDFYALIPVCPEEIKLELEGGVDAPLELLNDSNIAKVIDIHRKNVTLE